MSTIIAGSELLFTYAEAAKAIGCEEYSLRSGAILPDHFGTPGHWKLNRHSVPCLTERGLLELADSLRTHGNPVAARSLEVLREQRTGTPSRALALPPIPKGGAVPHYAWQDRKDAGQD